MRSELAVHPRSPWFAQATPGWWSGSRALWVLLRLESWYGMIQLWLNCSDFSCLGAAGGPLIDFGCPAWFWGDKVLGRLGMVPVPTQDRRNRRIRKGDAGVLHVGGTAVGILNLEGYQGHQTW